MCAHNVLALRVQELEHLPNLTTLDMSYNVIRDMEPVKLCSKLQTLYLASNKVTHIKGDTWILKRTRRVRRGVVGLTGVASQGWRG